MNIIDVILIIVISLAVYSGWSKGFIQSLTELATWLGSFLLAFFLSEYILRFLQLFHIEGIWVRPVLFIALLLGFSHLISTLCDRWTANISAETHFHIANKISGILPGFISGVVYASLISFFVSSYPMGNLSQRTKDSILASTLSKQNEWPGKLLAEMAADIGYRSPDNFTVHTKGTEILTLPFKTSTFRPRPDLELRMLQLINDERRKAGLGVITFDNKLAVVATKHSSDMLKRGYFSHYTPEGKSPFDRMRKDRVRFIVAGENLALAQTLQSAHEGLMESPVHKANILHVSFGRAGIGILDAGVHGIMVTQNFRN
ncbi:CvpA family protein [Daejeonella sp.]|uniref:CvpA family protein n=1 Tax=Daejeonella sp. TaxID=2805397 RepID=UPI0030BA5797